MTISETVRHNIQRFRDAWLNAKPGRTKMELCASVGISRRFWDDVEDGHKKPSITTLERMADALGVTVRDLLDESGALPSKKQRREPVGARRAG
jgi:transcriptional regulator with XRE-family HTH domain